MYQKLNHNSLFMQSDIPLAVAAAQKQHAVSINMINTIVVLSERQLGAAI